MPYSKYKKGDNSNCVRKKLKNGKYKHVGCSTEKKIDDYLVALRLNSRESMNEDISEPMKKAFQTNKIFDISFNGLPSDNGNKISIIGKSIDDVYFLYSSLHNWLSNHNIAHKIATQKRINHSNYEQSKKLVTIYVPNDIDFEKLLLKIEILLKDYKGWNDIKTPFKGYKHYSNGIYFRNDRDEEGNYVPANKLMNEENKLKGGKADKLTPKDIAKKFDVSVKDIEKQIEKGKKVESEHTDDEEKQLEIASDHISEFPDYYDRLDKMEKAASKHWKEHEVTENTKSLIKRLIRENLGDIIFDENYFKRRIPFLKEFNFYDRRNRIEAQRISYHENVRKMYGDEFFVFPQFNASSEFVYYKQNINDVTIHNFIIKNSVHPMQPNNMSDLHYKIFIMALKQLEEKNSYSHEIILNKNEEINNVELDEVFNNINKRLFKFEEFSDENNTSLF